MQKWTKANAPLCSGHPSTVKCKLRFFENVLDLNNIIKKAASVIEVDVQQLQKYSSNQPDCNEYNISQQHLLRVRRRDEVSESKLIPPPLKVWWKEND